MNQGFCFVAVFLFAASSEAGIVDNDMMIVLLWKIVLCLCSCSMMNFVLFLLSINKEYLWTFYDTRTGKTFLCDLWRNGKSDKESFMFSASMRVCMRVLIKS